MLASGDFYLFISDHDFIIHISLACENGHGEIKNVAKIRKRVHIYASAEFIFGCTDDAGVAYKNDYERKKMRCFSSPIMYCMYYNSTIIFLVLQTSEWYILGIVEDNIRRAGFNLSVSDKGEG